MTAENYELVNKLLLEAERQKASRQFIEGYLIGLSVYVGDKISQEELDKLRHSYLDIPYTLVVDHGKPDSREGLGWLQLKAALQEAERQYQQEKDSSAYFDIYVYDCAGQEITERQDIAELIDSIITAPFCEYCGYKFCASHEKELPVYFCVRCGAKLEAQAFIMDRPVNALMGYDCDKCGHNQRY